MTESTDIPGQSSTEYDAILEKIAHTDIVDSDWPTLCAAIKEKLEKNISLFLATTQKPPLPAPYSPITTALGGLKLPPFLPRPVGQAQFNDTPVSYMTEEEANEMKENIFAQLDQFESNPPFTIQRLCELCLEPKRHYKSVGKYLRAVEKSILVTSTWDSFPPLTEGELNSAGRSAIMLGSTMQSAPSTPLFSPIPFLHDDARRSKSRSPPPTPFTLDATMPSANDLGEVQALGLVDELDDPNPGHMSDHPTALSSVTSLGDTSRPFLASLDQRFVKSEEDMDTSVGTAGSAPDNMDLDEDKENTKAE
ncbi:Serine/threonine-protein phosphatase 4 regulatory subunit 2 [Psilocybe cubensis]|uniref:PPP4R2-domain-containing protein n=2 Tax=Psilocybe cubensis TaxID=181762 RepID=A0A8H8CN47_PSICU|nr:Serine/threonine-protein phosphatase 4 regulatory subunit 2 [Psilocybe cubensis]KAH9483985.1 Serine/threonine-protein phosphatase 4 regulatory subunit 2 [Psilocybe cubensis]